MRMKKGKKTSKDSIRAQTKKSDPSNGGRKRKQLFEVSPKE